MKDFSLFLPWGSCSPDSYGCRGWCLPLALEASAWFPTSRGGSALRALRFTTQWTQCVQVKGQEPRARPQPQHLTVMLKDHTQWADLWGLHRTWAGLSNKAVYGLSVYLCPASGTWFTAYYSKTMTHRIFNSNDRMLRVTKSKQSAKIFLIARQKNSFSNSHQQLSPAHKRCSYSIAKLLKPLNRLRCKANYLLKRDSNNKVAHCKSCQGFLKRALIRPADPRVG